MGDEKIGSEAVKAAGEIVKAAYEDALKPPATEIGKALGTVGRAVNVALMPLRATVWSFEQIEGFVAKSVSEKLAEREVPEENIITPDPDVAVPTVEALRYTKLKDLFAALLATAMNSETSSNAHPSFVEVIKQLSAREASFIRYMYSNGQMVAIYNLRAEYNDNAFKELDIFLGKGMPLENAADIFTYGTALRNLQRLGILEISKTVILENQDEYLDIENGIYYKAVRSGELDTEESKTILVKGSAQMTAFGRAFCKACIDRDVSS